MPKQTIPDRSDEPAVQESLDHDKSTTAANSDDVEPDEIPEERDDEGNAIDVSKTAEHAPAKPRPDSEAGSQ